MGYYKDTGSLQSMASAEAILKKRMPEKVGILPVAELIGFMDIDGVWCVFHAMVPPTKKFKRELGWR